MWQDSDKNSRIIWQMFLYTSHWYCLSKWCFNTNTQLLLLSLSKFCFKYNKWRNVSRCGIDSLLSPLGCMASSSHICIFRIFNSEPFPPSLTLLSWLLRPLWVGWGCAGDLENYCSPELCSQLPSSVCPWNLRYLTDFLESIGETHFSSHRWPLQALVVFIPDFSWCLP